MALVVRKISEIEELNTFLRGGILAGVDIRKGVWSLDGRTLVFTTPAATVTFASTPSGSQVLMTAGEILTQINGTVGLSGFAKIDSSGKLAITNPAGTTGVALDNTGTANALLGFDPGGVTGVAYNEPGGSAPKLISISPDAQGSGCFVVLTDE